MRRWGRGLAGDAADGSLAAAVDRAIGRVRRAVANDDAAAIREALAAMHEVHARYEGRMKNRFNDSMGRSRRAKLDYLLRCRTYLAVGRSALIALGDPGPAAMTRSIEAIDLVIEETRREGEGA